MGHRGDSFGRRLTLNGTSGMPTTKSFVLQVAAGQSWGMSLIRRAEAGDLETIKTVVDAAYRKYVERMALLPAPMLRDYAQPVRDGLVDLLCVDGRVIGLLSLVAMGDHLLVENVAIDPIYQGRGWGGRLMAHAEEVAKRDAIGELRLYTNAVMRENIDFYRRLGFVEVDRRTEDGYDRVFMRKQLIVIRGAQPADYRRLGELLVKSYENIPGATLDPDYNLELRDVAARVDVATVLVATIDSTVVGGITYIDGGPFAELSEPGEAEVRMFAVDELARGIGVGGALLHTCVQKAHHSGSERLWLSTSPWMKDAQRLYEHSGFRRIPARDRAEHSSGKCFELWAYVLDPITL